MRLVIDARMLDHSGIGTYVTHVLPGVLARCERLRPLVLTLPGLLARVRDMAGSRVEVQCWATLPLSIADVVPPRGLHRDVLWWAPHFNLPLFARAPAVVTLHDLLPLNGGGRVNGGAHKRFAVRLWLRAIRRRARRVICISAFTRDEAVRLGGIAAERTSIAHPGVDAAWSSARTAPAVSPSPYLVFVGLVKPHKNLLGLLRAFETLMPEIAHRLVVVGRHSGIGDADAAALALARRLAPRVELIESLSKDALCRLVAEATALVQPSFHEGFGLPPLEAMAAGTPVIAARAGAIPEVCGDAAVYCDPHSQQDIANAIRRTVADPALREAMRRRGIERARKFTWAACADATSDALLAAWDER